MSSGHRSHEKSSLAIDMDDVRCETMQNEQSNKIAKKCRTRVNMYRIILKSFDEGRGEIF